MKRIAIGLIYSLVGVLLMTSCKKDVNEWVNSSEVALLSFSIKGLRKVGNTVISGSSVSFPIDQLNRTVENKDSIMFGADISRVLVSATGDGNVCYLNSDGELCSIEDSIDFTNPVTFRVISYDAQFTRDYTAKINVHQVDPKKTTWQKITNTDFLALDKQKAFVREGYLYVIGSDADGAYYTVSTEFTDGTSWKRTPCLGIEGTGLSVLFIDGVYYLRTDAGTYRSEDAITWTVASEESEIMALPGEGIKHGVAWFSQPLSTNTNIKHSIFVATSEVTDTCAQVWTKLSTESNWIEIGTNGNNVYGCPNLENLAVIRYADKMYAFGGKSMGDYRKVPLNAFSACYESRDNGITWKVNESAFSLPKEFEGRDEAFSAVADEEYVWVMWSNGEVWRGRWNGIK